MTCLMPSRCAASAFSFSPPIGSTSPVSVTSPVMATSDRTRRPVSAEVSALPGVTDVNVDLATGQVMVTADKPVTDQQVREAVEEAGYTLAS